MPLKPDFFIFKIVFLSVEVSSASRQAEQLRNHYLVTPNVTPPLNSLQDLCCGFKAEFAHSLGWQTCQKPPGLYHLCQKHLQEKQYMSRLNWVLSTIAKMTRNPAGDKGLYREKWEPSTQILLTHQLSYTSAIPRTFVSASWMPWSLWMHFMVNFNSSQFFLMF